MKSQLFNWRTVFDSLLMTSLAVEKILNLLLMLEYKDSENMRFERSKNYSEKN